MLDVALNPTNIPQQSMTTNGGTMATPVLPTLSLEEKLDKIRSPKLQSQQQVIQLLWCFLMV